MKPILLELDGVCRAYPSGDEAVVVLKDIHLQIEAGEMVAIVGASGSGKSTLMNILGCLDKPTQGIYRVEGRNTSELNPDELAKLRREHFGFIFQRYHLLADLNARGNVEIPAIYSGKSRPERHARADAILKQLGLAERITYRPGQLSGGQQQRVSIARALMNGGKVILADEPTGALDSHSGQEVMNILKDLNAQGHTIILVTHDMKVAEHAQRIIEISDGEIVADRKKEDFQPRPLLTATPHNQGRRWKSAFDRSYEALRMALIAMNAHRMRTFLTMLGIIIGIAAVVSVVALGEGSRQKILKDISAMGTNTIDVYPGEDFGDRKSSAIHTLKPADAQALQEENWVDSVTPSVSTSPVVRYGNQAVSAQVSGVGEQYFRVRGLELAEGRFFDSEGVKLLSQEVVIDDNTKTKLFPKQSAVGEIILIGNVPCRIVGVTQKKESGFGNNSNLSLWIPYTTAMGRITGDDYLKSLTVRVKDGMDTSAAEAELTKTITQRHGRKDFYLFNSDSVRQTIEKTTATMTLLVSMIAVISLIVGGIGVMNIMLVSVTERTREIGVRMAIGGRQSDIMQQFLIEAVLVCLCGGILGILLALSFGVAFSQASSSFRMVYSVTSIVSAFTCATLIGVIFGFLPARNAARLDPVEALARE